MSKKVLIVEDTENLLEALEYVFTAAGYDVKKAEDGAIGLEVAEKNKFDVIITDLVMPNKDGFAFIEGLVERKIKTPVIIVSNVSSVSEKKRAKELGVVAYFVKVETELEYIVDYVSNLLENKPNGNNDKH